MSVVKGFSCLLTRKQSFIFNHLTLSLYKLSFSLYKLHNHPPSQFQFFTQIPSNFFSFFLFSSLLLQISLKFLSYCILSLTFYPLFIYTPKFNNSTSPFVLPNFLFFFHISSYFTFCFFTFFRCFLYHFSLT